MWQYYFLLLLLEFTWFLFPVDGFKCVELSMREDMNKKDIITQNVLSNKECYIWKSNLSMKSHVLKNDWNWLPLWTKVTYDILKCVCMSRFIITFTLPLTSVINYFCKLTIVCIVIKKTFLLDKCMYVKNLVTPLVNIYIKMGILSFRCQVRYVNAIDKQTGRWGI